MNPFPASLNGMAIYIAQTLDQDPAAAKRLPRMLANFAHEACRLQREDLIQRGFIGEQYADDARAVPLVVEET